MTFELSAAARPGVTRPPYGGTVTRVETGRPGPPNATRVDGRCRTWYDRGPVTNPPEPKGPNVLRRLIRRKPPAPPAVSIADVLAEHITVQLARSRAAGVAVRDPENGWVAWPRQPGAAWGFWRSAQYAAYAGAVATRPIPGIGGSHHEIPTLDDLAALAVTDPGDTR